MAVRRALVVIPDSAAEAAAALRERLEAAGFELNQVDTCEAALPQLEDPNLDLVLCHQAIAGMGAAGLWEYLRDFGQAGLPFVLLTPEPDADLDRLRRELGVTAALRLPADLGHLGALGELLLERHALASRAQHLEEENAALRRSLAGKTLIDPDTHFYRFDLFKQVMLLEVKRAQRYGYPLSIVLVAFDNFQKVSGWLNLESRRALYEALRKVVGEAIRDIDIPLLFAEDKVLLVLPHTELEGAAVVGDRIRDRIHAQPVPASLTSLKVTVSVAVAATGGPEASFGKMIQAAMRALKEAELKGGDLVILCRSPDGAAGPQACTDSGGKLGPRTFIL
ncbi:MAG TPA: diguanylate cyclase [Myxococcota bacterium]|nr:diguanylate cyclase [Myxococcota bacterium]HRY93290.1 diguanylate cyclase [Myxococcota bacterium]HSA20400.1 diguanylate cyclase [Myxococcota bacterium]